MVLTNCKRMNFEEDEDELLEIGSYLSKLFMSLSIVSIF